MAAECGMCTYPDLLIFAMQNRKGPRIRQGSPQEEEALVAHIASLAPSQKQLEEVGELNEFLILLDHESDARKLQNLLSEVAAKQQEAAEEASTDVDAADSPAGGLRPPQAGQTGQITSKTEVVNWKWDILRAH